ncbi:MULTISPECIES: kdo(2)-lipid A phosphoethanolamine 7''-transferase [Tatumella]|uniref:Kdo(2)-lipid A phosphoethanolamine 7''-transferase n=1 Tax=Tatumella punctata TaxID=399969 RepID=A0ABW1VMI6_9GAMM|nr:MULTISPECIES: kdo(2)-lipid A phosphoethanolamine 7''-transferase [unclassified Tatumella]MBS0856167.1 kdo(2)-lipid A phosphoethanolamine 7''-transferase [Tatumella sp. JGM16]MBS0877521.1 kdo(2)-lipid A phosphoethanolamine 7''-transferase [Tatumella sp. JGM82]MBS0891126.1 kdo(2)-lipid A phosphoethanolamine 7''-transferase [Tatumella sp. JGM94]MBS0894006.1 kdo(2)-lipid A phosphoethanolamine 7''-transferase [Tatumella sp. JGM130]MBS0902053.1 kdo(2)-lipid A phosphoethanolamine 7''-transferase [
MNKIKLLTQSQLSWILALYIGVFLNWSVFERRFQGLWAGGDVLKWSSAVAEVVAAILACFIVFRFVSLGGKIFFRLMASVIVVISVSAGYYMVVFNVVIGYGIVASVLTTDTDLSKEVVGHYFYLWMVLVSVLPLFLIWRSQLTESLLSQLTTRGQRVRALTGLVVCIALVWLPLRVLDKQYKHRELETNIDLPSYGGMVAHSYLPVNWLTATGLFGWAQLDTKLTGDKLFSPASHFTYVAPQGIDDTYVVFVIGETTRWDHMGILGYPRDTTPLLAKEKNLVAFKGHSCDTATKLSLRCMFVREGGAGEDPGRTLKEQNVFAVLKALGFSSGLYAMQSEIWFYRLTDVSNMAFREQIGSEPQNNGKPVDDSLLIPKLQQSLQRHPQGKHLVILHTKGSHYLYSQRYPRSFAFFTPECIGVDDFCSKDQLINSFDNSVRYVDYMLDTVFDQLRDKKAIVFYVADHGESISSNTHFHGTPREMAPAEQFRVPMLVWASDKYLADDANRQRFSILQQQAKAGVTHYHRELYDSLLGCLGYTSPDGGIRPENNWCQNPVDEKAVR